MPEGDQAGPSNTVRYAFTRWVAAARRFYPERFPAEIRQTTNFISRAAQPQLDRRPDVHMCSRRPPIPVNYKVEDPVRETAMGLKKPKSIKHNGKRLSDILEAHECFFRGKEGGARADLSGADLSGADLSGVNLAGAILRNVNLEGSDLRRSRLPGADLSGANLRKADLRNTDMTEASLAGANLEEAQASGVEFFRCDLSNTSFRRASLRNANFRGANVNGAVFAGADMGIAILRETDLTGADLSGVDLSTTLMPRNYAASQVKQTSG